MSRPVLLCCAVLALAGSLVSAYWARPVSEIPEELVAEQLVAEQPAQSLGNLRQGATVTTSFRLLNQCSVPIRIEQVLTSCDCAKHKLSASELRPGEAASVEVTWHMGAKRGTTSTGVTVAYRRQGKAQLDQVPLSMTADVLPDVVYTPTRLVFEPGKAAKQSLHFSSDRLEGRLVLSAYCTQRAFTATPSSAGDSVEVTFDPSSWPGGGVRAELMVQTASPTEPTCRIELEVKD